MRRKRGRPIPARYEDLTEEEVGQAREAVHKVERSRGRSYDTEEPESWIGRKARALKERFKPKDSTKAKAPGRLEKARTFYSREIKGGLQEAKEELGLEDMMEAAGRKTKKGRATLKKLQAVARKRTAHMGARGGTPAFLQAMTMGEPGTIGAHGMGPSGPHFMQSVTRGSTGPRSPLAGNPVASVFGGSGRSRGSGSARNPVEAMGWGSPLSRSRQPGKKRAPRAGGPGTVTVIIGGRGPRKGHKKKTATGRPVGLRW
jgi:hypothetical protein